MLRDCNVNKSFYEHVLYNPANNKSDFIFVSIQKATNALTLLTIPIYEVYIFYFSLYTCLLTSYVTIFCKGAFFSIIKLVFRQKSEFYYQLVRKLILQYVWFCFGWIYKSTKVHLEFLPYYIILYILIYYYILLYITYYYDYSVNQGLRICHWIPAQSQ